MAALAAEIFAPCVFRSGQNLAGKLFQLFFFAAGVNGAALLLLRLCLLYGHAAGQTAQIDAVIRADQHDNQAGNTADFSAAATATRAGTASVFDIVAAALVVQFHGDSFNSMNK